MCGIFGYVGSQDAVKLAIDGLKRLEYRGYDSAGIAGIHDGHILHFKEVGKVAILEKEVLESGLTLQSAIAHTRWATHGGPTQNNAHPHCDTNESLALVHNGIIENHDALRARLKKEGVTFQSDTDTEVIAHLISSFYSGDLLKAVQQAIPHLKGSYAIAVIHKEHPDQIVAVAHESSLVVGIGKKEAFVSSDSHAFLAHTKQVVFLSDAEIAVVRPDKVEIFDSGNEQIDKEVHELNINAEDISKDGYDHYTLKEIHEQPQTIRNTLLSRYLEEYGTATFEELNFDVNELNSIERVLILACGTSWHAGCLGAYMIEERARLPVQVEISSEFRYKNPIIQHGTFVIAISQSGETADTMAALREIKAKGAKILGICNVHGSTMVRESDSTILLRAGPEIGVCSTKAFTNQIVVLSLLSLLLARMRHMERADGQKFFYALQQLPDQVKQVLDKTDHIEKLAKKYQHFNNFFYIGRRYMYPTALEGALKLKEISYINANGYPAGELKHGPIALINESCPTVALCANKQTYEKILSNLKEVKARSGPVIAIAEEGSPGIQGIADDIIWIPKTIDELACIPSTVATQLFAYYVAKERGEDIDQPNNLAKSVTVE